MILKVNDKIIHQGNDFYVHSAGTCSGDSGRISLRCVPRIFKISPPPLCRHYACCLPPESRQPGGGRHTFGGLLLPSVGCSYLRWVAPVLSVDCSCHYNSEMKLTYKPKKFLKEKKDSLLTIGWRGPFLGY